MFLYFSNTIVINPNLASLSEDPGIIGSTTLPPVKRKSEQAIDVLFGTDDCAAMFNKRSIKKGSSSGPRREQSRDLDDEDQEEEGACVGGSTAPQKLAVGSRIAMSSASELAPYVRVGFLLHGALVPNATKESADEHVPVEKAMIQIPRTSRRMIRRRFRPGPDVGLPSQRRPPQDPL